ARCAALRARRADRLRLEFSSLTYLSTACLRRCQFPLQCLCQLGLRSLNSTFANELRLASRTTASVRLIPLAGFRRPNRGTSDKAPKEIQTFSLTSQRRGRGRKLRPRR